MNESGCGELPSLIMNELNAAKKALIHWKPNSEVKIAFLTCKYETYMQTLKKKSK